MWTDAHKWNGPTWTDLVWSRTIWKLFCVNIASGVVRRFVRGLGLKRRNFLLLTSREVEFFNHRSGKLSWWQRKLPASMIKKVYLENKVQYWPFIKKESGSRCSTVDGNKPDCQVPMASVWRPSISHCAFLGSSGKQFPCLWKINHPEYRKARYPLEVSTGTSHRVRPVRHLRHEQQPET